jgi:rod shape-determining protein MreD
MAPVNHSAVMLLSLVLAVIFSVMPVSGDWIVWKPNFLLLVTMGWIFHRPLEFGIFFAAGVGLLADCLLQTTLGHSVLVFALCGTLVVVVSRWVKYLSILQRTLLVYLIILFVGFLEASIFLFYGLASAMDNLLMKTFFSALTWPVIDKLIARACSDER